MKAFIKDLLIIQVVCFCVFGASAQCLNDRGEKVVSRITLYKFSLSTLKPFMKTSVDFSYNEKMELTGIDWTQDMLSYDNTEKYVINREGNTFSCVRYENDKLYDGVDYAFEVNDNGMITSISFYTLGRNGTKILPGYLYRLHYMIWYDGDYIKGIVRNLSYITGTPDWRHDSGCSGFEAFNSEGNYNYRKIRSEYYSDSELFFNSSYRYLDKKCFPVVCYDRRMDDMNVGVDQILVTLIYNAIPDGYYVINYFACSEWIGLRSRNRVNYIELNEGKIIKFERTFMDDNVVSIDTYEITECLREGKHFHYGEILRCTRKYHMEIEYLYD